jgi:hypothetical protein
MVAATTIIPANTNIRSTIAASRDPKRELDWQLIDKLPAMVVH